jgi:hypothetical protein
LAGTPGQEGCTKIVLNGEVNAGHEWKAAFGQGWVFRVVPIEPGKAGYSGWDLVVDREPGAGFPDALLLATPPYDSINEREVGTTFGLRAQDAIGWNPRSFRFLVKESALQAAQRTYRAMYQAGQRHGSGEEAQAAGHLVELADGAATGQFRIVDARLAPGTADAAPYAENWATQSARTQHTLVPPTGGKATPLGELDWMRFSMTLWLPAGWKAPRGVDAVPAACSE